MGHLFLVAALATFMAPAIANSERSPLAGRFAGHTPDVSGAISPAGSQATGSATTEPGRLKFIGAVVTPAGGAHPGRPIVSRQVVEQTIHQTDFRVLEIVYR